MFGRLFGKKPPPASVAEPTGVGAPIEMFDQQGNRVLIDRNEYRTRVLPGVFQGAWDHPDKLYNAIVLALNDGFVAESLAPAERLREIDPIAERSTTILGIVLMKNDQLERAERVLSDYLEAADSGVVATNLAKVYDQQGRRQESRATLRRALAIDPNQDNGLDWYAALAREEGGDAAFLAAMHEIASEPGSWLPQLWIARDYLEHNDAPAAMRLYEQVLSAADIPADGFMMISGDLGTNGHIEEIVDLLLPVFDARAHGIEAGLNLVQACIESRRKQEGLRVCDELLSLGRYDRQQAIEERRRQLAALP